MIIQTWHDWVGQPRHSREWHEDDIADELQELREAVSLINKWSETSDVVYTVSRARWSGHEVAYPLSPLQVVTGHIYMYPKYSLRVLFFRAAGKKLGAEKTVTSVRNPRKVAKLQSIALENGLDPERFVEVCQQQLRRWVLLP